MAFDPAAQQASITSALVGSGVIGGGSNGGQVNDPTQRPFFVMPELKGFTGLDFMQSGTGRFFNAQMMPGVAQVTLLPKMQAGLLGKLFDEILQVFNKNPFLLDHAGDLSQQEIAAFAAQAEYEGVDNKQLLGMLAANTTNIMNAAIDTGSDLGRG